MYIINHAQLQTVIVAKCNISTFLKNKQITLCEMLNDKESVINFVSTYNLK